MKRDRSYLPLTVEVVQTLGAQIAAARRELGWTAADLAGRLGVSIPTVARIEKGAPSTAIGTVLEAAVLCGVPLFGPDRRDVNRAADQAQARLALLPERVRVTTLGLDNDF
jgi:transcriptional regulator with XRE-family HTH domain